MVELFTFQFNNVIDISFFIVLFGLIFYYFGKLIVESEPKLEEKTVIYVKGFFFVVTYIFFPLVLIYTFYTRDVGIKWWVILVLVIQYLLTNYLAYKWKGLDIQRSNLKQYAEKRIETETKKILKGKLLKRLPVSKQNFILSKYIREKFFYSYLGKKQAFLISIITILSSFIIISKDIGFLFKFFSFLMTILTLSYLAMFYELKPLREVEVILDDGSIKGMLNKIEKSFVNVLDKKYAYNINKDRIIMLRRATIINKQPKDKK